MIDPRDPRTATNLHPAAYLEFCKAFGAARERWQPGDIESAWTAAWECALTALSVYEFERAKDHGDSSTLTKSEG